MGPKRAGRGRHRYGAVEDLADLNAPQPIVRSRMWTLVGTRMRTFGSRGLGVSTFPWRRVTDTREKELPLIILRPEGRGRISYPGLGQALDRLD
ncbi:hypothetical protein CRG98_038126 [Punica granatum]|uniref:Uncharacterized protein n=1 Tax=Punica granatum TaxID=22663 RepID=A0A2I0IBV8_PUNGR|nr:hypothetical protein CRG98_038126 [Punica granatum]